MKKVELSLVDKILSKVGLKAVEIKLETMKLDDGQTTVEAEMFEADQPIVIVTEDDQKIALPVGEYGLEDGRIIVVQEEGIIFEIKEVEEEVTEEAPADEPVAASNEPTPAPVAKRVVESVSKESYFSKVTEEEVIELIAKVVEMSIAKSKEVELSEVEEEAPAPRVQNPEKVVELSGVKKGESITAYLNRINK